MVEIRAGAIPTEGVNDLVDIPLILNHSGDVRDTIGSVRSAFYENGELIFEAGILKREMTQSNKSLKTYFFYDKVKIHNK